jgi:DNA-binding SARP family transcriptional activator/DNA-binding CsgD family transcriptional regulator
VPHRHSLRASALGSVVSEAVRERVEGWRERGPLWALGLEVAGALVAFRQGGETARAAALPWETPRRFSITLVPPMVLELAIAAASRGNAAARAAAEELAVDHRVVLRRLAASSSAPVAREAQALLRSVPERPRGNPELCVLGPLELVRAGTVVDDPALRRERVRALLQYLVAHGEGRRDELGAKIWPELSRTAAANNLRVTLTHIRNLLEPDRDAGAPSFFLPQSGEVVTLRLGDGLSLDAMRFAATVDQAESADRAGDPAAALARYEDAIALYRGDYLADAPDQAWGDDHRGRMRARLVDALLRVAELRLGRNELDRVLAGLTRALELDPLNERVLRTCVLVRERRDGHAAARQVLLRFLESLESVRLPDPETCRLASRFGLAAPSSGAPADRRGNLGLSTRELEVLRLVDRGLSNGEIARKLFVAPSTVKTHLENVYGKLGVRRRTQALAIVREQGLL